MTPAQLRDLHFLLAAFFNEGLVAGLRERSGSPPTPLASQHVAHDHPYAAALRNPTLTAVYDALVKAPPLPIPFGPTADIRPAPQEP
jgi:hypothetical protein